MKQFVLLLFILLLPTLWSCGGTAEGPSDPALLAKKQTFPFNTVKVEDAAAIKILRESAKALIALRQEKMKEDLFDLVYYHLNPRGFSNLGTTLGAKHFEGYWTKFEKDYTFSYGIGDKVIGSGIFHFSNKEQMLLMLDNDTQIEPKLWSVLSNSEFLNFLGHPMIVVDDGTGQGQILMNNFANDKILEGQKILAQGNNGMQIMMTLLEERPKI